MKLLKFCSILDITDTPILCMRMRLSVMMNVWICFVICLNTVQGMQNKSLELLFPSGCYFYEFGYRWSCRYVYRVVVVVSVCSRTSPPTILGRTKTKWHSIIIRISHYSRISFGYFDTFIPNPVDILN